MTLRTSASIRAKISFATSMRVPVGETPSDLNQRKERNFLPKQRLMGALLSRTLVATMKLSDEDVRLLDAASDPGVPYPKWMVLQLDTAEDPRSKALYPERYADGGPWKDLRGSR